MKKYLVLILAIATFAIAAFKLVEAGNRIAAAPTSTQQSPDGREAMNTNRLAGLLSAAGLSVNEGTLLPARVDGSREMFMHWNAAKPEGVRGSAFTGPEPGDRVLSTVSSRLRNDGLSRERSFELSPTLLLFVSIDEQMQVRWWSVDPDPRILRAEVTDRDGKVIRGPTLYHYETAFIIAVPDDKSITEVRIFEPIWNGSEFSLQPVGAVPVK